MDIEHTEINFGRIATLAVVATFPGLRRAILVICLLGLAAAGVLWLQPPVATVVNPDPVCNRVAYLVFEQVGDGPREWGQKIYSDKAVYYKEANGTGYCMVKHDDKPVLIADPKYRGGIWKYRFYEVPSKYGPKVQEIVPADPLAERRTWAVIIALISGGLLLSIWLPAAIMAAMARRWTA